MDCWPRHPVWFACVLLAALAGCAPAAEPPDPWLQRIDQLEAALPPDTAGYARFDLAAWQKLGRELDGWTAASCFAAGQQPSAEACASLARLLTAKRRLDALAHKTLERRIAATTRDPALSEADYRLALRQYLRTAGLLIELSGRMEFNLTAAFQPQAYETAGKPEQRDRLIDLVISEKSGVGLAEMAWALLDPPPDSPNGAKPLTSQGKRKLLAAMGESGRRDVLPILAEFVTGPEATADLLLPAIEAIRRLGLPQDPRPGQAKSIALPAVTAADLHARLAGVSPLVLTAPQEQQRQQLLAWLAVHKERGLVEDSYRLGSYTVKPGDWILTRSPSPYNRMTDLSPGLFTHVGVVAMEQGSDGKRRMVIIDLNERGAKLPATNVDAYVEPILHYAFVRHAEPEVGQKMGEVAVALIGAETEFDLLFRTELVEQAAGQPLAGRKVHTYCAGLLLLCALETGHPRSEFFPVAETAAAGSTAENLKKLGLELGKDFVSPSGPLFSPRLELVGMREAMYDPSREIEERVFDHFALAMAERQLSPAPDLYQSLRLKVAEASKGNPLLAQALAAAAGVSANMDLVSAAKAAALIETLDTIAYGASRNFREAITAVRTGPAEQLKADGFEPDQIKQLLELRQQHQELWERRQAGKLSILEMRNALVEYYVAQGQRELDQRFFSSEK